ncbi:MAG: hypothetical protein Q8K93_08020 [Reyranella sp.]|nr:hypothetical protein [Reyranella sp.]
MSTHNHLPALSPSVRDAYTHQIESDAIFPIRRWGETEDVGKAVAGLVSGDIPISTGGSFYVDGGLHIPRFSFSLAERNGRRRLLAGRQERRVLLAESQD